jgi:hypothetical protein
MRSSTGSIESSSNTVTPFVEVLEYVHVRRFGLEVFLTDPGVPMDTNHLERALRVIPVGRNYPRIEVMQVFLRAPHRPLTPDYSTTLHFLVAVMWAPRCPLVP